MKINLYASSILLLLLLGVTDAFGQTFTAVTSGDWNVASTWDQNAVPNTTNSTAIVIGGGYTVTIPDGFSVDANNITVNGNATLTVAPNGTLNLTHATGTDLDVVVGSRFTGPGGVANIYGTLIANDEVAISSAKSNLTFFSGSTYEHAHVTVPGNIPLATWNSGSTVLISSYTTNSNPPGNLNQSFHHFTWNTPNLNNASLFIDLGISGNTTQINGNFTISSTGSFNSISLSDLNDYTLFIGGNLVVENNADVFFSFSQASAQVDVAGNFSHTSSRGVYFTDGSNFTLNVDNSFTMNNSSGYIDFVYYFDGAPGSTGAGNAIINIKGDLNFTAGSLNKPSSLVGTANINFNGTSLQTFTSGISVTDPINYTVKTDADLNLGTSVLSGAGNFTLENNSGLRLGSSATDGAWQNSTTAGNIQVGGTRTSGDYLTITYNGTAAQKTGLGFPETKNVNLTIENPAGVTLSENVTITSTQSLNLNSGNLNIGSNTLTIDGSVTVNSGALAATTLSNLSIGGVGALGTIPFSTANNTLNNFTLFRGLNGSVTLGGDLTVIGTIAFTDGTLNLNGNTLTLQGGLSQTAGTITSSNTSSLVIQGTGALGNLPFETGSTLGTLVMDRTSTGSAGLSGNLTITNLLDLSNGTFNNSTFLTMDNDATLRRAAGGSIENTPSGTYRVEYASGVTTGVELPDAPNLSDLIINGTGTVILNKNIAVNDSLMLTNGTLDMGTRTVEVKNKLIVNSPLQASSSTIIFSGGGGEIRGSVAPAFNHVQVADLASIRNYISSFSVAGNWTNNGTFNAGSSTVTFNGTTTISGAVEPTFNHVNIAGALTAPSGNMDINGNWTFTSGSFTPNGGTITLNGGAQTLTTGGQGFHSISFAGSGTKILQDALDVNGNLAVTAGATLSTGSNQPINLAGNWTNDGSFTAGAGTVYFDGTTIQQILGSAVTNFNNMNVSNIAGPPSLQVNSHTNLLGVLTLAENVRVDTDGGTADSDGGVNFTLVSSASRTAAIATLPAGAVVNGNVVVQRHMPAANVFRYITTPAQGATVGSWADDFTISTNTLFKWDETDTRTGVGYVPYGNTANPLIVGSGYAVKIPATADAVIASSRGRIQHTDNMVNFGVTYTNTGNATDDGWNLVGNPFPSTIDLESIQWTWTNVNPTVSIPDNTSSAEGTIFATYNRDENIGLNGGSRYVASGQAFWVQTTAATPSLVATEAVKAGGQTGTPFFRSAPPQDYLIVALNQGDDRDETAILFREGTSTTFENSRDSYKRPNGIFNLATLTSDGVDVSFNLRPWFECFTEVALKISNIQTGSYTLDFSKLNSFTQTVDVLLIDNYTNSSVAVEEGMEYAFAVTEEAASKGSERFTLRFATEAPLTNLSVKGSTICDTEAEAFVGLGSSQTGVTYQVFKGEVAVSEALEGNDAALSLPVTTELLETGSNELHIFATQGSCESLPLEQTASVVKNQTYQVTNTQGASLCGSGTLSLQAAGAPEGGSYHWYASAEATTPIEGATEATFITPELNESSTYYVSILSAKGCESSERVAVAATIFPVHEVQEVTGASSCGAAALTLQASGAPEGATYRWYSSADASTPIEGATAASFTTPELSQTTAYYVSIINAEGCESTERVAVTAEINVLDKPEISLEEETLVSSYAEGNQWFLNGSLIEGATEQTYTPTASGTYSVRVLSGECQAVSEAFAFTIAGIEDELAAMGIQAYPNPAQQKLQLRFGLEGSKEVNYTIYASSGRKLVIGKITERNSEGILNQTLDVSGLKSGMYTILLNDGKKSYTLRFIKK